MGGTWEEEKRRSGKRGKLGMRGDRGNVQRIRKLSSSATNIMRNSEKLLPIRSSGSEGVCTILSAGQRKMGIWRCG